jgi:hypothetical protein
MAGLGTSACSGGCSDTGVTVKRWCRIALDLRWMVEDEEPRAELTSWDAEHLHQAYQTLRRSNSHGREREGEYIRVGHHTSRQRALCKATRPAKPSHVGCIWSDWETCVPHGVQLDETGTNIADPVWPDRFPFSDFYHPSPLTPTSTLTSVDKRRQTALDP